MPHFPSAWPARPLGVLPGSFGPRAKPATRTGPLPITVHQPNVIPNCFSWFQASEFDGVANGTEVITWTDQSIRQINATATGGAASRPTVAKSSINTSMTSLATNGSVRGVSCPAVLSNELTWTVFTVVNFTLSQLFFYRYGDGGAEGVRMGLDASNKFLFVVPNSGNYNTNEAVTLNAWHYVVFVSDAGVRRVYVDGVLLTWAQLPTPSQSITVTKEFALFDGYSGGLFAFKGNIADAAFYDSAVSDADRVLNLEGYSRLRYAL